MASVTCVVRGCYNTSSLCPKKQFFKISFEDERFRHWLRVCQREDLLCNENTSSSDIFAVCSDHFIGDDFENSAHTKLKDTAVPTVFPTANSFQEYEFFSCAKEGDYTGQNLQGLREGIKVEPHDPGYEDEPTDYTMQGEEKHAGQLCRLCANTVEDAVYVFTSPRMGLSLEDKINSTLPVVIRRNDPLPKQLCKSCVTKVNICHEFAETCIEAERKLYSILNLKHFRSHVVSPQCKLSQLQSPWLKKEASITTGSTSEQTSDDTPLRADGEHESNLLIPKVEDTDDVSDESLSYSCPLCCEGIVSTRKKVGNDLLFNAGNESLLKGKKGCGSSKHSTCSEEDTSDSSNAEDQPKDEMEDGGSSCSVGGTADGWWNPEIPDVIIEAVDGCDSSKADSQGAEGDTVMEDEEGLVRENSDPNCCICGQSFLTMQACLEHANVHFQPNECPCSICGRSFVSESDLLDHQKAHSVDEKRTKQSGKRLMCDYCGKRFNTERTYTNHSCVTPETKQFRCSVCKKSYNSEERLAFHRKFHEGAKLNACEQCGKEFDNEGSLYYHTRMVHERERPFECEVCSKKFYSNSRLVAHKRVHTGERPFECEVCGRRFYDRETLKGHYVTHLSVKPFQCDLCGMCWGRKSMLNQHLRTHHSESQTTDSHLSRRAPSLIHYYCKICDVTFTSSSDVLSHRTTHWDGKKPVVVSDRGNVHPCEYCGQTFALMSALGKHRKEEHPKEQPYICSICKETSHTLYEARVHRKAHIEEENRLKLEEAKNDACLTFVCEACGNVFTDKRKFMRHLKEHKVGRPYRCKVCAKDFRDNQRLTVHMRQHTGEKPYTCTVCGKKFTQTSALYTHTLLHTGEKPHICDLCGKAFRIKADRDNHRRTHTGEKPYKCEFCGKSFRTGQVYYQHRMIHTGERRFPCDVCGKAFKRSHTLVVHKRIHTGEKPNICDVCGKGFRQRSDMRKHRNLHGAY